MDTSSQSPLREDLPPSDLARLQQEIAAVLGSGADPAAVLHRVFAAAERARRDVESTFVRLFENLPDFIIEVDRDARIIVANRAVGRGRREDLYGRRGFEFLVPEHRAACEQVFQRTWETAATQSVECLDVFGNWWAARLVPLCDDGGSVRSVLVINTDIGAQRWATAAAHRERQLLCQAIDLHERERQLVACDIHDGFAQQLTAALFHFQAYQRACPAMSAAERQAFQRGMDLLARSIDETRRLISGLRPPILDELGVVAAIDYLCNECRTHSAATVEFIRDVEFDRLAPPLECAIFRIVQEALNNASRHSRSPKIRVELFDGCECVKLSVRDWGRGFDPTQVKENRFGLRGIRDRVRLLHGRVTVQTAPDQGTHIAVELPLVERVPSPGDDAGES